MEWFGIFLRECPLMVIALVMFTCLILARELGGCIHARVAGATDEPPAEAADKSFVVSGMLGLLALLIAFTFNLAVDRYETRRKLVVAEANAIGTAEMRARLLKTPDANLLVQQLRGYARTRMAYGLARSADKPPLLKASAAERATLQKTALAAIAPVAASPLGVLVTPAVNSVLDVGVERETALAASVPPTVVGALMIYAVLTVGMLGYSLTGIRARHRPATVILSALLTLTLLLILDLDRPQGGSIRTDQTPMVELVAGFK